MNDVLRREIAAMRWLAGSLLLLDMIITFSIDLVWFKLIIIAGLLGGGAGALFGHAYVIAEGLPRPFLRLVDVTTLDARNDKELYFRTGLETWLVFWVARFRMGCQWGDAVSHIVDYWRDGRLAHSFPIDTQSYQKMLWIIETDQTEVPRD